MKKLVYNFFICLFLGLFSAIAVHAQGAGTTGTFTSAQTVFVNQGANTSSAIFRNIGQSAHFLFYCNTNFLGAVNLEVSFNGTTNWVPISSARYILVNDSGCHVLQAGGYFPNTRSTLSGITSGTISAWYASSSGPIAYAPVAMASDGPHAPIHCDHNGIVDITQNAGGTLVTGISNTDSYLCMAVLSFSAAPAAVAAGIQIGYGTGVGCVTTFNVIVQIRTTANTPQIIELGSNLDSFVNSAGQFLGQNLCLRTGAIGAINVTASYTFAQF